MTTRDESEAKMEAALKPFGWTCGPEFWQRYYSDPWVFKLANAVERLTERLEQFEDVAYYDQLEAVERAWMDRVDAAAPDPTETPE